MKRNRRRILRASLRSMLAIAAAGFGCLAFMYLTLPDVRSLRTRNPESTAFIDLRVREAQARGEAARKSQRWVSYARISGNLKRAVLVAEDSAFWKHDGVDYDQLKMSMEMNMERMEFARGGSTITQQLAKNLYLSPSKSPIRKMRELMIARELETELSKQRILELYLNVVEWGDGIYGAEAAARTYFHKPAAELGAQEAALLAGALVNPRLLDPAHPTRRLRWRQEMVLRRMGAVTPPPVVAGALPELRDDTDSQPPSPELVPAVPLDAAPASLPGQPVPLPQTPGRTPGGGGTG